MRRSDTARAWHPMGRLAAVLTLVTGTAFLLGSLPTTAQSEVAAVPPPLDILLTFDDGPVPESIGTNERTAGVLNFLQAKGAKAAFFIQIYATHDEFPNRFTRANTPEGIALVRRMREEGHVIGIHSASFENHVNHTFRVNTDGIADEKDELWRDYDTPLEDPSRDGRRAIAWMKHHLGAPPEFVRPCFGDSNPEVRLVYRKFNLKNILWDIDPEDWKDEAELSNASTELSIEGQVLGRAAQQKSAIVVLFHDTLQRTTLNLPSYVAAMERGASRAGRQARLVTTRARAEEIMRMWAAEHGEVQ